MQVNCQYHNICRTYYREQIIGAVIASFMPSYYNFDDNVLLLQDEHRRGGKQVTTEQSDFNYDRGCIHTLIARTLYEELCVPCYDPMTRKVGWDQYDAFTRKLMHISLFNKSVLVFIKLPCGFTTKTINNKLNSRHAESKNYRKCELEVYKVEWCIPSEYSNNFVPIVSGPNLVKTPTQISGATDHICKEWTNRYKPMLTQFFNGK